MATKKQAAAAEPVATTTYRTNTMVHMDGDEYPAGSAIELSAEQAKPLLDVKAVELPTA